MQAKYETNLQPISIKAYASGSLHNSTFHYQNSTDMLNDSLKPREVAKAALTPHVNKPTRPEYSMDSSTVISPNEKNGRA